jgi:predicted GIY-YIG superfamily endonuclease
MSDIFEGDELTVLKAPWIFYLIQNLPSGGCTYAGVSPTPMQRLRRHNGEISGGAKYTTSKTPGGWSHVCLVHGFQSSQQALQFEWAVKHVAPRSTAGLFARLKKLHTVLCKERWTSKAPLASTVPLVVEWCIPLPETILAPFASPSLPAYVTNKLTDALLDQERK